MIFWRFFKVWNSRFNDVRQVRFEPPFSFRRCADRRTVSARLAGGALAMADGARPAKSTREGAPGSGAAACSLMFT
jgi:hypothetical protein